MMPAPNESSANTAAILLWVLAALQIIFFGCCSMSLGAAALMPYEQLAEQQSWQQVDEQALQMVHNAAGAIAIGTLVGGCVPAIAYLILGFFVKQIRKPAIITTIVILAIQTLIFALLLGLSILGSLAQGNIPGLIMCLFLFGAPVGLQSLTMYYLFKAMPNGSEMSQFSGNQPEPWE